MDEKIITGIIGLVAGAISGTFASLTAPWIHWTIEKRRQKLEYRRKTIGQWRNCIEKNFDPHTFRETIEFSQMCEFLSNQLEKELNPPDIINGTPVHHGRSPIGRDNIKDRLLLEIATLEKMWKLI